MSHAFLWLGNSGNPGKIEEGARPHHLLQACCRKQPRVCRTVVNRAASNAGAKA